MILYYNPDCSKSQFAKKILDDNKIEYTLRYYLDDPLSKEEVASLLDKLDVSPRHLLRTKEKEFEPYSGPISRELVTDIVSKHPILLQRPIIEYKNKAKIARDLESINAVLQAFKII